MGSPGGSVDGNDSPGRGSDEDSRTSSRSDNDQRGMTGSERAQEDAFDDALSDERDNQPGGPEFGDTTPGYGGPNPDPRGPALDNRPDDREDEDDNPATPDPGGLPDGDTTPNYTGPNPDPRGPALTDDEDDRPAPYSPPGFLESGLRAFIEGPRNLFDDLTSKPIGTIQEILNSLGPGGAVFGILGAGTRAAGKYAERAAAAVADGLIGPPQASNFARFEKKLPSAAGETRVFDLPDGGKLFQAEVPGKVPGSKAVYEKSVDIDGKTIGYTKSTFDPDGNLVHVKQK